MTWDRLTAHALPIVVWMAGALVAWLALGGRRCGRNVPWLASGLGPIVGFGGLSWLAFGTRLVTGTTLSVATALTVFVVVVIFAFMAGARRRQSMVRHADDVTGEDGDHVDRKPHRRSRITLVATSLVLAASGAVFFLWSDARPDGEWDAMAIWNTRARFLHRAPADGERLAEYSIGHPDYPLLLPASVATQFDWRGDEAVAIPQTTALCFYLALGALVFGGLRSHVRSSAIAAGFALWVVATPLVIRVAQSQVADVPLALAFLAATLGIISRLDDREPWPASLVGFLVGMTAWTKNEGIPLALILGVGIVLFVGRRRRIREGLRLLTGAALPLLALVVFKAMWPPTNDMVRDIEGRFLDHLLDPDRWSVTARGAWRQIAPMSGFDNWALAWPVLAGLAIVGLFRRRRSSLGTRFATVVCLTAGFAWWMVYVLTPRDQTWHVETSMHRLMLQLFPVFVVTAALRGFARRGVVTKRRPIGD